MTKTLLQATENIIVNDVNISGVVETEHFKEIRDSKYQKEVLGSYLKDCQSDNAFLGKIKLNKIGEDKFILNAYIQNGVADSYGPGYIDKKAILQVLKGINRYAKNNNYDVAFSTNFGTGELTHEEIYEIIDENLEVPFNFYGEKIEIEPVEIEQNTSKETLKEEPQEEEEESKILSLAITGHRPVDLSNDLYNMNSKYSRTLIEFYKTVYLSRLKEEELDGLIIVSGMALGIDMVAAKAALELKYEGHPVYLEAAVPFETQDSKWSNKKLKEEYYDILVNADLVTLVSSMREPNMQCEFQQFVVNNDIELNEPKYSIIDDMQEEFASCMQLRNQYMLDQANELLAFWNGKMKGGTYNCIVAAFNSNIKVTGLIDGVDVNEAKYKPLDYETYNYDSSYEKPLEVTDVESYVSVDNVTNRVATEVMYDMLEAKDKYFKEIGQANIIIHDIHLYNKPYTFSYNDGKQNGYNWGIIAFQIPKGILVVKNKDSEGNSKWVDVSDYDISTYWRKEAGVSKYGYRETDELKEGNGIIRMAIQSFDEEEPFVSFPNRGQSPLFKALDLYKKGDEELSKRFSVQAVNNIEALLSAVASYSMGVYKTTNLKNNLNKGDCQSMIRVYSRDEKDYDIEDKKSKAIYPQIVVEQLTENGNHRPNILCTRFESILGTEASRDINNALRKDRQGEGLDERTNEYREARHNEFVIGNKIRDRQTYYEDRVKEECMGCPFYASCGKMTTTAVQNDIENKGYSLYVYKENLRASKVSVQCKTNLESYDGETVWTTVYPNEVLANEEATLEDIRFVTVGGITASFVNQDVLLDKIDFYYEPEEEEYNQQKYDSENKISFLFSIANNVWNETEERIEQAIEIGESDFDAFNESQERRFEVAVNLLASNLERLKLDDEKEEYPIMFSGEVSLEGTKVDMEQLTEMFDMEKDGSIGYGQGLEGLQGKELMNYLLDQSQECIDKAIYEGEKFVIVGGTLEETILVAGAMQAKLQMTVNQTLRSLRKSQVKPSEVKEVYSEEFSLYYYQNSGIKEEELSK